MTRRHNCPEPDDCPVCEAAAEAKAEARAERRAERFASGGDGNYPRGYGGL